LQFCNAATVFIGSAVDDLIHGSVLIREKIGYSKFGFFNEQWIGILGLGGIKWD